VKKTRRTDAEVWADPRAERTFELFNVNRNSIGLDPLTRDQATEAVRQMLEQDDKNERALSRARRGFGGSTRTQ
jgi:hypothetical protein